MARRLIWLSLAVVVSIVIANGLQAVGEESQAAATNYEVRMKSNKFDQKDLQIKVGDTVSWLNDDDGKHSVTPETGSALMITEIIVEGGEHSARTKFETAGVLKYKCKFHSGMTGTVTVTAR